MSMTFQKAKFYQNLKTGNGSKQRFSLLQEKAVFQAVCLRTQAVSIKGGGGSKCPPPAGLGLIKPCFLLLGCELS